MLKRIWNEQQKQEVVDLYLKGFSISKIAREYFHCRTTTISKILTEANVDKTKGQKRGRKLSPDEQKKVCELYVNDKLTQKQLSIDFNCCIDTIKNTLINQGIEITSHFRPKNLFLIDNYFENINTEEKAYFLGFLFADGNVFGNKSISLEIQARDRELLEKFKQLVNSNGTITYRERLNTKVVALRLSSEKMVLDLAKYGIVPNKTIVTTHLPIIPKEHLRHFLRGLVDGDGWITLDKQNKYHLGFVNYYKTNCRDFQDMCNSLINTKNKAKITKKSKDSNSFVSQFQSQEQVRQLVTALYKDSNIYLTRKYAIAEGIFEFKNDEDIV